MIHRFELKQNGHLFEAHNLDGDNIKNVKYVVDVEKIKEEVKITHYNLRLYRFGREEEISIGSWTFKPIAKGEYDGQNHCSSGTANGMTAKISAISPYGDIVEIHYKCESDWKPIHIAECFLNGIFLASCCNSEKEYNDTREAITSSFQVSSDTSIENKSELLLSYTNTIRNKAKCDDENQRVLFDWLYEDYLAKTSQFLESLLDYERRK